MSFKVNAYDPQSTGYAPRIKHEDWERHRKTISHLHAVKTPRKLMLKQLRDEYGFTPTLGQLQAKCKEWNLKVYAKEAENIRLTKGDTPTSPNVSHQIIARHSGAASPAFHLATESGFVDEWADDYRVHPVTRLEASTHDRSLPPEYIGGGLLANTVDSHWPIPDDVAQADRMLQAGHYYFSLSAYQQAFSIYRAVYLYQHRHLSVQDPQLINTVLRCACSAVTDHQRNIMHSVLCHIGSSVEVENLDPLVLDCLQTASLSMISSDVTCDIEAVDASKARATAYFRVLNSSSPALASLDLQANLYNFEHSILLEEHNTKILQRLLGWAEIVIEHVHHEIDDIFVGYTRCVDEYHRRVSQVLSGYLLAQWNKSYFDHDDQRISITRLCKESASSLQFHLTSTQTIVALAFIVVDAVRCDPMLTQFNRAQGDNSSVWFLDAAKLFKRGIRMLSRLDDRSRCAVFTDSFLERFHTPITYRRRVYEWTASLPAIVDTVGISLAQGGVSLPLLTDLMPPLPDASLEIHQTPTLGLSNNEDCTSTALPDGENIAGISSIVLGGPSPTSECNSIASFINTYHRTLTQKLEVKGSSGKCISIDMMSLTSSTEFKFGVVANTTNSADIDSLWKVIITTDNLSSAD